MSREMEAASMFKTLCSTLDNMNWKYSAEESGLIVRTGVTINETSFPFFIKTDADRSVMYLKASMPFLLPQERLDDMLKALIIANFSMLNGTFEANVDNGYFAFKIVVPFMESLISEKVCRYMVSTACSMLETYAVKLSEVAEGKISRRAI